MSKYPAEIYIGKRIERRSFYKVGSAKLNSIAVYYKPDNGPKYIQIDVKKNNTSNGNFVYIVGSIHAPPRTGTGLPKEYDKMEVGHITDDMMRIFTILDSRYE